MVYRDRKYNVGVPDVSGGLQRAMGGHECSMEGR